MTRPPKQRADLLLVALGLAESRARAQALILGAKVHALLSGRGQVDYEDVRAMVRPALRHRLLLNFEGQAEGMTPDKLVARLLEAVPDVDPKLRAEARR